MKHEEQDELWDLLGKARAPKERPFFAAKVLNAIQADASREPQGFAQSLSAWWQALRRRWVPALAGCAAVALAFVVAFGPQKPGSSTAHTTPSSAPASGEIASADPLAPLVDSIENTDDLVASLDNLLVTQDNSIWLHDAPSSLY